MENQRKRESSGNCFDLHFYFILEFFPSVFLCDLFSKHFIFSHLSYQLYPIYRILFLWERVGLWFVETTKWCNPLYFVFVLSLLCRGDCEGDWVSWYLSKCRGDCCSLTLCLIPLSEKVIVLALWLIPLLRGWSCFC